MTCFLVCDRSLPRERDMSEPTPRFWEIFFEVYEPLPRQGPGSHACAARALGLCRDLPRSPAVLDLGCGVGGQTLHLAELTSGSIVAIDSHAPSIERLRATVAERGLADRFVQWSATWPTPSWRPRASISSGPRGALQHRHRERPTDLPRTPPPRCLPCLHRRGLAQGEPAARGQGELRLRLPDHGPSP